MEPFDFDMTLDLLRQFIRIDTSNPPGFTRKTGDFLAGICEREGIEYKIFEPEKDKINFMAKIEGNGEKPPLILLNHLDVVPVEREKWSVEPFEGIIKDGYLWGRGTTDMKTLGICQLMCLISIKRRKLTPNRDIYFLGTCDEEIGGEKGAGWMLENVPELRKAQGVINEGLGFVKSGEGILEHTAIETSEKVMFQIRLTAQGTPGHASMPLGDNPNLKIIEACHKLIHWQPEIILTPVVEEYFNLLWTKGEKEFNIKESLMDEEFKREFLSDISRKAMVTNTIVPTVLKAGAKSNVIPSFSEAIFDIRLLPAVDNGEFLKKIKKVIDDPHVSVEIYYQGEPTPQSSIQSEIYKTIKEVLEYHFPSIPVVPKMLTVCTDSRYFRKIGINSYGIAPVVYTQEEARLLHGNDERVSLENIRLCARVLQDMVDRIAGV